MVEKTDNYWKDAYKEFWTISNQKEKFIKEILEKETNLTVVEYGLGAGSDEYIEGSSEKNNLKKGDADLYIESLGAYIEVTGPLQPTYKNATLWFRPDKLNNAFNKLRNNIGKIHILVHIQDVKHTSERMIRCIVMDEEFFKRGRKKEFNMVYPIIRGRQERFIEILSTDKCLISLDDLIIKLNEIKTKTT